MKFLEYRLQIMCCFNNIKEKLITEYPEHLMFMSGNCYPPLLEDAYIQPFEMDPTN